MGAGQLGDPAVVLADDFGEPAVGALGGRGRSQAQAPGVVVFERDLVVERTRDREAAEQLQPEALAQVGGQRGLELIQRSGPGRLAVAVEVVLGVGLLGQVDLAEQLADLAPTLLVTLALGHHEQLLGHVLLLQPEVAS